VDKVTLALLLISVVHLVGAGLLVALLFDGRDGADWRGWWPRDDGRGPDDPPPAGGPPLPSAEPADVRLRTVHDRIAARRRRRRRLRSAPEPERVPVRR
jgi:hypothetical protein